MQGRRCWNCMSEREKVHSPLTGIAYCASCGIATSGPGVAAKTDILHLEKFWAPEDRDRGEDER